MTVKAPEAGEETKGAEAGEEEAPKGKGAGETQDKGDEKGKGEGKENGKHEPPPNSPRWNEVYNKMKHAQAKVDEQAKDIDALRSHSQKLSARLEEIADKKADKGPEPRPDPATDPEAYAKWVDLQYKLKEEKAEKERVVQRLEDKRDMAEAMFDDYNEVVKAAERDMERDPALKKTIWSQPNPFIAAYKYADKKRKTMTQEDEEKERVRKENQDKGHVEGGGAPEGEEEEAPELDEQEQRVIRNLWPELKPEEAKKKYLASRKKMFKR